jgi:choice-of-anchor A domain-containing protein
LESSIGFNFFNSDFNLGGFNLSFFDYHVISFGGFKANTGDIEGRLAARGTVDLGYGFSVADKIEPKDNSLPYSIIGGSLSWGSGALYPDGR